MSVKPRRKAVVVDVGGVKVGGDYPIVVQSMTNTDTVDVPGTVNQVMALARAGSELVRITVNTEHAAAAVPGLCRIAGTPVIADPRHPRRRSRAEDAYFHASVLANRR